jgi:hypothetical protein
MEMERVIYDFSKTNTELNLFVQSNASLREAFSSDIQGDLVFLQVSISLIVLYCVFVLGGFTPV